MDISLDDYLTIQDQLFDLWQQDKQANKDVKAFKERLAKAFGLAFPKGITAAAYAKHRSEVMPLLFSYNLTKEEQAMLDRSL